MNLQHLRVEVDEFAEALSREEYRTRAGLAHESRAAAIRAKFFILGSREAFESVRDQALAAPSGDDARRLRYLAEFLGATCVEYRTRDVSDRIATAEAVQTVTVDGEQIPLQSLESRIKNTADRSRRGAVESARLDAVAALNGLRQEILESSHDEARRLGFSDYPTLCRNLSGVDLAALRELTRPILARTRDMYEESLAWYLRR